MAVSPPAVLALVLPIALGALWLSMAVSLASWVAADAAARGSAQPRTWAVAAVFTPIGLPYYLYKRRQLSPRSRPPTHRERWAATWASAGVVSFLIGALVSPPDPSTQILTWTGLFPICLLLAYLTIVHNGR
ncbi:hypothetical protein ACFR9U_04290 [Halorientalis brevis]|uniref:Uncharacterized protein n=1 Tax=Halorientalis brevis TaxID=1126241 RepID=A0ABD6C9M6_9EURY|nr:hypothetical protein [Halorientalis brevis]